MDFVVTGNSNGIAPYSSEAKRRYGIPVSFGLNRRVYYSLLTLGILRHIYTTASACSSRDPLLSLDVKPLQDITLAL